MATPDPAARAALRAANVGLLERAPDGRAALVVADPAGLSRLRAAGLRPAPVPAPPAVGVDPEGVDAELAALAAAHSDRARLVLIGESVEGRPIRALVLGAAGQPRLRLLGAHHGDEAISAALCLAVARALLDGGPPLPAAPALDDRELWIIPQVNPDGLAWGTRNNANGVDLNRNYGEQWREAEWASGEGPFSEPEVAAVRMWASTRSFAAGLSAHAGALNIGWVWNWTTAPSADALPLEALAIRYAALVDDPAFWVTNGAEWYVTYGDTTDWAYARQGTFDYTLEISAEKAPAPAAAAAAVEAQLGAALDFLLQPLLVGRLVDAETGRPTPGWVRLAGGGLVAAGPDGLFARPAVAGLAGVAAAPGYAPARAAGGLGLAAVVALTPEARGDRSGVLLDDGFIDGDLEGEVLLHRFGEASVAVDLDDPGALLDAGLLPGPWDVEEADGRLHPRALLVPPGPGAALGPTLTLDEDGLLLGDLGEVPPREAYLLSGPDRAWAPVTLRPDAGAWRLPDDDIDDPEADLVVFAAAKLAMVRQVGAAPALVDGGGGRAENRRGRSPVYGCAAAPLPLGLGALVSLALLILRRSAPCPSSRPTAPLR